MEAFHKIVIADYKQRTRSYAFLVTLAISLYAAYSFVPPINANYTTVRIGDYVGVQNSAWIGYVTAMMTSVFLSMVGFYLVNSGIKKDVDTGVGMIVATTPISNFQYLLAKAVSNFLVLLSITGCVFLMSIALFFVRSSGYPFEIGQFILPYLLIPIPAIAFIAALAVVGEVFLHRFTILMNIGFYILFCLLLALHQNTRSFFDLFGFRPVTDQMQAIIVQLFHQNNHDVSMGFLFGHKAAVHSFVFDGVSWGLAAIVSRIIIIISAFFMVLISSRFFHRFDIKQTFKAKKKVKSAEIIPQVKLLKDIKLSTLPSVTTSYGIMPLIKTELLMLFRKGPRWLWLLSFTGMIALVFTPLAIAHQMILPILWFLQVGRWSDLATKEKTNRIHYFTYASYKPLSRLLTSQVIAGIVLALALASPLLVRLLLSAEFQSALSVAMGSVFIILFAVTLGILSGGKKLFEILFFFFTYANLEMVPFTDYFGGENRGIDYLVIVLALIAFLAFISFTLRKMKIRRL